MGLGTPPTARRTADRARRGGGGGSSPPPSGHQSPRGRTWGFGTRGNAPGPHARYGGNADWFGRGEMITWVITKARRSLFNKGGGTGHPTSPRTPAAPDKAPCPGRHPRVWPQMRQCSWAKHNSAGQSTVALRPTLFRFKRLRRVYNCFMALSNAV